MEIVTDRSQEGAQFVKGFGGVGGNIFVFFFIISLKILGLLRYQVDFAAQECDFSDDDFDLDDYWNGFLDLISNFHIFFERCSKNPIVQKVTGCRI